MTPESDNFEGPRDRSSSAYALLFAPPELRTRLRALLAFRREIDDTLFTVEEPGVARLKRAWWGEEIARLASGEARHPITRALSPARPGLTRCLGRYLAAADSWSDASGAGIDFFSFCAATGGSLAEASVSPTAPDSDGHAASAAARDLGTAIRSTALLRMGRVAPAIRRVLAGDDLCRDDQQPALEFSANMHTRGIDTMPADARDDFRTLIVLASLYRRLLEKMTATGPDVYVELTAPAKLWTAWSTARSIRKQVPQRERIDVNAP